MKEKTEKNNNDDEDGNYEDEENNEEENMGKIKKKKKMNGDFYWNYQIRDKKKQSNNLFTMKFTLFICSV
jgi:hypothetical protein